MYKRQGGGVPSDCFVKPLLVPNRESEEMGDFPVSPSIGESSTQKHGCISLLQEVSVPLDSPSGLFSQQSAHHLLVKGSAHPHNALVILL